MALKKLKTGDPKVDEALEDIYQNIEALQRVQILRGHEIEVTFLTAALTQRVLHKLNRPWQGYFLVDVDAGVTIFRSNVSEENPNVDFYLTSSAPAVATIWVY